MDYYQFFYLAASSQLSFDQGIEYLNRWFHPNQKTAKKLNDNLSLLWRDTVPYSLLQTIVAYQHDILILLANDFGHTLRIVYRMLRAVQLVPRPGEGNITQRPRDKSYVWTRDKGCVITGHDSVSLPPQYAHIIPHAITKYSVPHTDYFAGIRMIFGDTVCNRIWDRCGGPNCNSLDNMTSYCPNMHDMIDRHQLFLRPVMGGRIMKPMDIVDVENQLLPGQVLKFNYAVEFLKKEEQAPYRHTTKRKLVGAGQEVFWRSLDNGTVLTDIEPGYAMAQAVSATVGLWAALEDFRDGEAADLGHWASN